MDFDMGKYLLKMVFSIGITVAILSANSMDKLTHNILAGAAYFMMGYAMATVFGIALRITENYLIAGIVFILAFVALFKGASMLVGLGKVGEILTWVCGFIVFVWPVIGDTRKAILYIKDMFD